MATIAKSNETSRGGSMRVKRGNQPDETRPFVAHGHAEMHTIGKHGSVMKGVFEPGWKWSQDVAPIAGTKSCQAPHLGHVVSGRMHIRMDDGTGMDIGPGDFFEIEPGHDAWVLGDEPCVLIDFGGYSSYAERTETRPSARDERPSAQSRPT